MGNSPIICAVHIAAQSEPKDYMLYIQYMEAWVEIFLGEKSFLWIGIIMNALLLLFNGSSKQWVNSFN